MKQLLALFQSATKSDQGIQLPKQLWALKHIETKTFLDKYEEDRWCILVFSSPDDAYDARTFLGLTEHCDVCATSQATCGFDAFIYEGIPYTAI